MCCLVYRENWTVVAYFRVIILICTNFFSVRGLSAHCSDFDTYELLQKITNSLFRPGVRNCLQKAIKKFNRDQDLHGDVTLTLNSSVTFWSLPLFVFWS